jgi:hypothetical protein
VSGGRVRERGLERRAVNGRAEVVDILDERAVDWYAVTSLQATLHLADIG